MIPAGPPPAMQQRVERIESIIAAFLARPHAPADLFYRT
jgi:hypothetical protein